MKQFVTGVLQTFFSDQLSKGEQIFHQFFHRIEALILQQVKQSDGIEHTPLHLLIGSGYRDATILRESQVVKDID